MNNGENIVSTRYKKGLSYLSSMNFQDTWAECDRFLDGQQWAAPTKKTANLPRPVFNIIKYIVGHKKSSVMADELKMIFSSMEIPTEGMIDFEKVQMAEDGADKFTQMADSTWERLGQDELNDEFLDNACLTGTGILHYFWDNSVTGGISRAYVGDFKGENIDPSNIYFGNPQNRFVQQQPWIIISNREMLSTVQELAQANGLDEYHLAQLTANTDTEGEIYDAAKKEMDGENKVTVLTQYTKTGTGQVVYTKVCNNIEIVPQTELGLDIYPIVLMNWNKKRKCIYGIGEVEGLIDNQRIINQSLAMMMLSTQNTAYPKILAKPGAIRQNITNIPGEILVDHHVGQQDGVKYMQTGQFSPIALSLTETFIDITRNFSGANDAATGQAPGADMSAQAIALLQKSSGVPLEDVKRRYSRAIKDIGRVYEAFWKSKYNTKRSIKVKNQLGEDEMIDVTGTDYQEYGMELKIDVGASSTYSEFTAQATLDLLYNRDALSTPLYLKYCPKSSVPYKDRLIKDLELELQQQAMSVGVPGMEGMPGGEMGGAEPLPGEEQLFGDTPPLDTNMPPGVRNVYEPKI